MASTPESVWVFGYGSLIWRQDFPFEESRPACVRGWERRFWQGSTDHRGRPGSPGRVVTLVSCAQAVCHGVAFRLREHERDAVLEQLDHRERGGYRRVVTTLALGGGPDVLGILYVADDANPDYLGPAPLDAIVEQVRHAHGPSGANVEYVRRLAASLRELGADDAHVFELEALLGSGH